MTNIVIMILVATIVIGMITPMAIVSIGAILTIIDEHTERKTIA